MTHPAASMRIRRLGKLTAPPGSRPPHQPTPHVPPQPRPHEAEGGATEDEEEGVKTAHQASAVLASRWADIQGGHVSKERCPYIAGAFLCLGRVPAGSTRPHKHNGM